MSASIPLRLATACVAALAGWGAWLGLRALNGEQAVFRTVARGFANPPFFIAGNGSRQEPWTLAVERPVTRIDHALAPVVVGVGDDPGNIFQSRPPSPLDFAVILSNLQRLGARDIAVACVLDWEAPDATAFASLELELEKFDMVVQAAPLATRTLRQAMPEVFARAALKPAAITGDASRLPVANSLRYPRAVFAGKKALAGFSSIEDTHVKDRVPLLARWEDDPEGRVVMAFPLLAVLAQYGLPVSGVSVRLGGSLSLGPDGPIVPLDDNGCLAMPADPVAPRADIAAEELICGQPGIFPENPGLIVLRDDQAEAPAATRLFSRDLVPVMASIRSDAGLAKPVAYRRLPAWWEALLILAPVAAAALVPLRFRKPAFAAGIALALAAQWTFFGMAHVWLPGVAIVSALALGFAGLALLEPLLRKILVPTPAIQPPPAPVSEPLRRAKFRTVTIWREPPAPAPAPSPEPEQPRKTARKEAEPTAKKSTARKKAATPPSAESASAPPAKKAARRRKTPPPEP